MLDQGGLNLQKVLNKREQMDRQHTAVSLELSEPKGKKEENPKVCPNQEIAKAPMAAQPSLAQLPF